MTKVKKALIIDDESSICESLAGVLSDEGWQTLIAENGYEGAKAFASSWQDLSIVFLDVWMPGIDGIETLQRLRNIRGDIPIVIMSGHGTIDTAVKVTKLGAYDYLEKPLSIEKVLALLEQIERHKKSSTESLEDRARTGLAFLGQSPLMRSVQEVIKKVADKNAWVLITGENGVGKEVVAQRIHALSQRSSKPFVAVNCAAIPEDLIESELFGYEKGAFTNASQRRAGKFEVAHRGTLFLDEIGDMSLRTQAKILRILQEQRFERLGGTTIIEVDVRVIAATNKDLAEEIKQGRFREDLYHRLNVIPIEIPPLRSRGSDIVQLAIHFLNEFASALGEVAKVLSEECKLALQSYRWPGNVRELKNLMERLSITVTGPTIAVSDLPEYVWVNIPKVDAVIGGEEVRLSEDWMGDAENGILGITSMKQARMEFEKLYLETRLKANDWNISKTAQEIGIERSHLHRKMKLLGIQAEAVEE